MYRIVKSVLSVILVLATAVPAFAQPPTAPGSSVRVLRVSKRLWLRYNLKGASSTEMAQRLERLYQVEDPWHLQAEQELVRFRATNTLIRRHFPDTRTILELGSGEGLQTDHLLKVATELYGVDVSPTAIGRAQRRVPDARLYTGDFRARPWGDAVDRFDLVVACEMLYFLSGTDLSDAVAAMSRLGRGCLVSFVSAAATRVVDSLPPNAERTWIHAGGVTWLVAWWRNSPG